MVINEINGVRYKLREQQDFSWLEKEGKVFSVIDETGSGCICFGVEKDNEKLFYKIAGAKTVEAEISCEESKTLLKSATQIYKDIQHPNLISLVKDFEINEFYVAVFRWAEGECLFDHWNFDKYKKNPRLITPIMAFKQLPLEKKLVAIEPLFSFMETVKKAGYVAVDFYDSSLMYDFYNHQLTICDIDLFRKVPTINDLGKDYFGTKRLKAPEENELGASIDEVTNNFTLGAIICDLLSDVKNNKERYKVGHFIINDRSDYYFNGASYEVLKKATQLDRSLRYQTIEEFHHAWKRALKKKVLYVSDLDGTLLRSDETISDQTAKTINDLVEKGMLFSYATARSFVTSQKVTKGINAKIPVIVYNGTFVIDNQTKEVLIANYFEDDIRAVILELFNHEIYPIVYSYIDNIEYFSFINTKVTDGMRKFLDTRIGDSRWREVDTIDELLMGDIFYVTCIDEASKLYPFNEKYQDVYHCVYDKDIYSKEQWFEIMPKKASKANAIRQLKEHLDCDYIVSFGDGRNDIDMFELSDECYAVSNANDELKTIATGIIESNDEDGVALFLEGKFK